MHEPVEVPVVRLVDVSCGICQRGAVHDLASVSHEHAVQGCLAGRKVQARANDLAKTDAKELGWLWAR